MDSDTDFLFKAGIVMFDKICLICFVILNDVNFNLFKMKYKFLFLILFLLLGPVKADWTDPFEKFDTNKNFTNSSLISWKRVDNPTLECSLERARRGFPKHDGQVVACSMWEQDKCLIITAKYTDRDTVGHEIQHCFQGKWH